MHDYWDIIHGFLSDVCILKFSVLQFERLGSQTEAVHNQAYLLLEEFMHQGFVKGVLERLQVYWAGRNAHLKLGLIKVAVSAAVSHSTSLQERHMLIYRPLVALLQGPSR